jgi:hypothetical protein
MLAPFINCRPFKPPVNPHRHTLAGVIRNGLRGYAPAPRGLGLCDDFYLSRLSHDLDASTQLD